MTTDLSNSDSNWLYQSNKLIEASHSFTVLEQKLIRLLASMVKKDDTAFKEYQFSAIGLSETLGIQQKNIYRDLDRVTDKLMARFIKVKNDDTKKFDKYHLVGTIRFADGVLTMEINKEMKEFYIKLEQYTKYKIENIIKFKSNYSFRVYELLKQYEKIGSRSFTVEDLKLALDIGKKQYQKYANFKIGVLNVAKNEINSNTDISFSFKEIKTIRKVTSIKFFIKKEVPKPKTEIKPRKKRVSNTSDEVFADIEHISTASQETCASLNEDDPINKMVRTMWEHNITSKEAKIIYKASQKNLRLIIEVYEAKKDSAAENFVGLIVALVKPGAYIKSKSSTSKGTFSNSDERNYNSKQYDEMEEKLLGWQTHVDPETSKEYKQGTFPLGTI